MRGHRPTSGAVRQPDAATPAAPRAFTVRQICCAGQATLRDLTMMSAWRPGRSSDSAPGDARIRAERLTDRAAIAAVVEAAFGSPDEARLVGAIRTSENFMPELSSVAEFDGQVVGHVMVSVASLHDGETRGGIATLSPFAAVPTAQGRSIGSALVLEVIRRADSGLAEPPDRLIEVLHREGGRPAKARTISDPGGRSPARVMAHRWRSRCRTRSAPTIQL